MNSSEKVKNIVTSAVFAAIICFATTVVHIPTGINGGYVHIGDAFIYLAACILPLPYAMVSAAIGAGFADLLSGAAVWVVPTIIIKPVLVLFFTKKSIKIINKRNVVATFLAGISGIVLYCFADFLIFGNIVMAFSLSLVSLIQPIGSGVVFIIIGIALDKINIKRKVLIND